MTFVSRQYSLEDFNKILTDGIEYTLDASVITILHQISTQVGSPEYIRTPQFDEKRTGDVKRHGKRTTHDKDININFSAHQTPKKLTADDTIRKLLNKITTKTYTDLFITLTEELDKIAESSDEYKATISSLIFTIVSETSFYSDMYAGLYASLYEKYEFLRKEIENRIDVFSKSIDTITYHNPDTDYDAFCKNNKENLKRKSIGIFLVNLVKHKIIDNDIVCEIIETIQNKLIDMLDAENKSEIVVELSEISCDMIVSGKDILLLRDKFKNIIRNVRNLSNMNTKQHKSLSNKTIFKNMDTNDCVKI